MQDENDVDGYNYRTSRVYFGKQLKPKTFGKQEIMNITEASSADLDAICVLSNQINWDHHNNVPTVFNSPATMGSDKDFWRALIDSENSIFFVARHEDKIQGFITARITQNLKVVFLSKDKICRVGTIVVSKEHRSKGIGRSLMDKVELWAKKSGAKEIRLEVMEFNTSAQAFYKSDGYDIQSRILAKPIA